MLLQDKRIFLIEDKTENRAIMQLLLEQEGAVIGFERWGKDVIERLQAFAPVDIILLDLNMPHNITGYDIYDQIRGVPAFGGVPIVAVSATDPAVAIPLTKDKGFAGFIAKPVDYELFPKQIARLLENTGVYYHG